MDTDDEMVSDIYRLILFVTGINVVLILIYIHAYSCVRGSLCNPWWRTELYRNVATRLTHICPHYYIIQNTKTVVLEGLIDIINKIPSGGIRVFKTDLRNDNIQSPLEQTQLVITKRTGCILLEYHTLNKRKWWSTYASHWNRCRYHEIRSRQQCLNLGKSDATTCASLRANHHNRCGQ